MTATMPARIIMSEAAPAGDGAVDVHARSHGAGQADALHVLALCGGGLQTGHRVNEFGYVIPDFLRCE